MNPAPVLGAIVGITLSMSASPSIAADTAVVLMYHRFAEDRYPTTSIRLEQFEAHLEFLHDGHYTVVPLADVVSAVSKGTPLPDRAVAITIDDAYRSIYDIAFPRLKARNYPFTVFVATDVVDDELPAYMSWEHMREMANGGASFANHGASHSSLVERNGDETDAARLARVRADIEKGARRLSEELDIVAHVFAYPYGEYDTAVGELLAEMDYISFGQQSGVVGPLSDPRALPRYPMAESFGDLDDFRTKVASLPMPVVDIDPWDPVTHTLRPMIVVTLAQAEARLDELACYVAGQGRVDVEWLEYGRRFTVAPKQDLDAGRHRVNCTMPRADGRYLWFSHQWLVRRP
jgi:peptidoglycan/xylan/chitin deacetylase (PgdA/CDA1 family)